MDYKAQLMEDVHLHYLRRLCQNEGLISASIISRFLFLPPKGLDVPSIKLISPSANSQPWVKDLVMFIGL